MRQQQRSPTITTITTRSKSDSTDDDDKTSATELSCSGKAEHAHRQIGVGRPAIKCDVAAVILQRCSCRIAGAGWRMGGDRFKSKMEEVVTVGWNPVGEQKEYEEEADLWICGRSEGRSCGGGKPGRSESGRGWREIGTGRGSCGRRGRWREAGLRWVIRGSGLVDDRRFRRGEARWQQRREREYCAWWSNDSNGSDRGRWFSDEVGVCWSEQGWVLGRSGYGIGVVVAIEGRRGWRRNKGGHGERPSGKVWW